MPATIALLHDAGSRDAEPSPWRPEPESRPYDPPFVPKARLLVVDDEPAVRTVVQRVLEQLGHDVQVAIDGQAALAIMASDPSGFDLVITDIRMPGIDGWQLGERIARHTPGLPILYMSGYDHVAASHSVLLLRKPFGAEELIERVNELLGRDHE